MKWKKFLKDLIATMAWETPAYRGTTTQYPSLPIKTLEELCQDALEMDVANLYEVDWEAGTMVYKITGHDALSCWLCTPEGLLHP